MKKKVFCAFLAAAILLPMLLGAIGVSAEGPIEIPTTWSNGYVGGDTHTSAKNKIAAGSDIYKYSGVIVIEKAGTRVYFTDASCAGDSGSKYVSATAYAISSWKKSGAAYVLDTDGVNIAGTYQYESVGQRRAGAAEDDGMIYEYISERDGEAIRFTYRCSPSDTSTPKVYMEPTTQTPTAQVLRERIGKARFDDDGTIKDLQWYVGYIGSELNTNGSAKGIRNTSASYTYTEIFFIPKAGTRITFSLSCSPNQNFNAISRYTKNAAGNYVYKDGFHAADPTIRTGSNPYTYSYVSGEDNEAIRIGTRSGQDCTAGGKLALDTAPLTVTWKYTGEPGTGKEAPKTEWPDPVLLSLDTGAVLIGTEQKNVTWSHGYVGSQYQDSAGKQYVYTSPSNEYYCTSNAFTVPKAGTRVIFFDQAYTDFGGGSLASFSVLTVSHWNAAGTLLDRKKVSLTGCEVRSILMDDRYRVYEYDTTEDNETIRLCLRLATPYEGEEALIPPVYFVEPDDFPVRTEARPLTEDSYTDASGEKMTFRLYLPEGYDPAKQYSLVFDASGDAAYASDLADRRCTDSIVVAAGGDSARVLRLLDEVVRKYPVRVTDILLIGGDDLASHAAKYENIRLAQAFLYTGSGSAPKLKNAKTAKSADFASISAAADWLLGETDDYYPVLEGLKMYAIGDSYFGGADLSQHQTWVNLLGYEYGMTFHNFGLGGTTIGAYTPLEANHPPMCVRYKELPTDGDIYFVEGGRNDRHYMVPFGTNTDQIATTFKGGLNIILNYLREKAPDALIVLVTAWSYKTESGYLGTNDDYAAAMRELAAYRNDSHIVCLNAADVSFSGINMSDTSCRAKYTQNGNDVSHLNADGMFMVKDRFEGWIAEQYAALKGLTLINTATDGHARFAGKAESEPLPTEPAAPEESSGAPGEKGCGSAAGCLALILALGSAVLVRKKTD